MNDAQLLELLSTTDALAPDLELPGSVWSREAALSEIERRIGMDTRDKTTGQIPGQIPGEQDRRWYRGWLVAAAAFIIVAAIGIALALVNARSDGPDVIDESPVTTLREAPVESGSAAIDAYFAALRAGDPDAIEATLAPGMTYRAGDTTASVDHLRRLVVWNAAQQTTWSDPICETGRNADVAIVTCAGTVHQYVAETVEAPAVRVTSEFEIDIGGRIVRLTETTTEPDFRWIDIPFQRFVTAAHPGDEDVAACCDFPTESEAGRLGQLRVQYADEWAEYMSLWGCAYDECDFGLIPAALSAVDAYWAGFEAANEDAVAALLVPGGPIASIVNETINVHMAFDAAAQTQRTIESCTAAPSLLRSAPSESVALVVTCDVVEERYLNRAVGAPPVGAAYEFGFTPDGLISTLFFRYEAGGFDETAVPFGRWMQEAHPADVVVADPANLGSSADEAAARAALYVQYADEWAAYLTAKGCTYQGPCTP